jgi:hypothetical protein
MLTLKDIRRNQELLDAIDWEMTPEEAVRLYLEWGNNWTRGNYVIRSKEDVSHYFVVNTWKGKPVVYLMRRNSEKAEELARIELPSEVSQDYFRQNGKAKGVFCVEGEVKKWLQGKLYSA